MAKQTSPRTSNALILLLAVGFIVTIIFTFNSYPRSGVLGSKTAIKQTSLTQSQVTALASDKYQNNKLPVGDGKYVTNGPKKGYVYLCNANKGKGGAQATVPWISGSTWDSNAKLSISGAVNWKNASFTTYINGSTRTLSGNDLPINHTTGTFPVATSDPAYTYDKNPNTISAQSFKLTLPTNPAYTSTPYCMGGEVGVLLSGVALFNAFDAELRDAVAHELQDSCDGHPQQKGQYHYHGMSSCMRDVSHTTVIGYALDGFPITGPKVAENKFLTTESLDECHGITSEISVDGKKKTMYHYVMTQDFPYSVSCFRGKPVSLQVMQKSAAVTAPMISKTPSGMPVKQAPQEAISACNGKTQGSSCSFTSLKGMFNGNCKTPPGQTSLICVPATAPRIQ